MHELVGAVVKTAFQVLIVVGVITVVIAIHSCVARPPLAPTAPAAAAPEASLMGLSGPPYLAVGLAAAGGVQPATVAVDGAWKIFLDRSATPARSGASLAPVRVSWAPNGIFVGNEELAANELEIAPERDGTVRVGRRAYHGRLRLRRGSGNRLIVANLVDLESYLSGVISGEMKLEWPDAALRAQAIAARTYALWEMKRTRGGDSGSGVDLMDDTSAQVYPGMERETPKARRVVEETRGQILVFAGALVPALYHSNCGGHTEPGHLYFEVGDIPPLAGRSCGYCDGTSLSNWKVAFPKKEIADRLFPRVAKRTVTRVRVTQAAPGGHAALIGVVGADTTKELIYNAKDFRLALGPDRLRSTAFTLRDLGASLEFVGRGWGHGVGLCQYGAKGMADQGFQAPEIVQFYYPGAELVRIY
ncbi:MAG: SpoIID/LytB domain-containing protein [Planctomycetes bacterium]|nr:SpoIID/LytB domain-containing protein [Planctomycetota bacterium]